MRSFFRRGLMRARKGKGGWCELNKSSSVEEVKKWMIHLEDKEDDKKDEVEKNKEIDKKKGYF